MDHNHRRILESVKDNFAQTIDFHKLIPFFKEYKIFNKKMLDAMHSTADILDELPCRGPTAFQNFIKILKKANYDNEAGILESRSSTKRLSESNLYYKMSSKPLGYCLIINNVNFDEDKTRHGSNVDAESLEDFFKNIDFDVTTKPSKTAKEMLACLEELSERDFLEIDSLIVFILSHGGLIDNKEVIYGTDMQPIYKSEIYKIFSNEKCGGRLQNKPKMFFFICCRGKNLCYPVPKSVPQESLDCNEVLLPPYTDFFIVHSTLPEEVSVLSPVEGSYFCAEFIPVLKKYYKEYDLHTIIDLANSKLQYKVSSFNTIQVAHVEIRGGTKKIKLCRS